MRTLQERVHGAPPPSSWALGKLHSILKLRKHFKNIGMKENNLLSLSYGKIVPRDIETAEGLLPDSFETYQIVEQGNIVLRLTDLQNDKRSLRQGLVPERGIITSAYDALEVSKGHDPRFWAYALLALDLAKYYYSLGGGVRQSINFADFPNEWISAPSEYEQAAIGDFLDRESARIEGLVAKKRALLAVLSERRKSAALLCLADGMETFDWRPDSQTFTFRFTKPGWATMRIKYVVSFMTSGSRGWSALLGTDGEAFVQSGNIGRAMEVDLNSTQRVQPQAGAEADRTRIKREDVLVCITGGRTGAVGFVRSIDERAYVNQHVCILRARPQVLLPELLAQILWSAIGQKQISQCQYGVKQGIGFNELANLIVPVPHRDAQPDLVKRINSETAKVDKLMSAVQHSIDRLNEFKEALITAAVNGRVEASAWAKNGEVERQIDSIEAGVVA